MSIEGHTGYFVTLTSRALTRITEIRLRQCGLGVAYMRVLILLVDGSPLTQTEIAERIHVRQPSPANLLERMAKAGLIERTPDPKDGRASHLTLSDKARDMIPGAFEILEHIHTEATEGLSPKEITELRTSLERVYANLTAMAERGR